MNEYVVSWTDKKGNEFYSDFLPKDNAIKLFDEICINKVDNEQVEACLYNPDDEILNKYNNIENKYIV